MAVTIGNHLSGLDRCPQCNVAQPLLSFCSHIIAKSKGNNLAIICFVYQCSSCRDIVCAKALAPTQGLHSMTIYLHQSNLHPSEIIPKPAQLDDDLPERPKFYLMQAINSQHAPDGAAMLAASSIDAMLKIKGLTEGSLYARIDRAVEQNILTQEMSIWAHAVRIDSNSPRHADLSDPHITETQAQQAVEFARALGDFLFVFPARVARGTSAVLHAP